MAKMPTKSKSSKTRDTSSTKVKTAKNSSYVSVYSRNKSSAKVKTAKYRPNKLSKRLAQKLIRTLERDNDPYNPYNDKIIRDELHFQLQKRTGTSRRTLIENRTDTGPIYSYRIYCRKSTQTNNDQRSVGLRNPYSDTSLATSINAGALKTESNVVRLRNANISDEHVSCVEESIANSDTNRNNSHCSSIIQPKHSAPMDSFVADCDIDLIRSQPQQRSHNYGSSSVNGFDVQPQISSVAHEPDVNDEEAWSPILSNELIQANEQIPSDFHETEMNDEEVRHSLPNNFDAELPADLNVQPQTSSDVDDLDVNDTQTPANGSMIQNMAESFSEKVHAQLKVNNYAIRYTVAEEEALAKLKFEINLIRANEKSETEKHREKIAKWKTKIRHTMRHVNKIFANISQLHSQNQATSWNG